MMVGGMGGTEGAMTTIGIFTAHPSLKGTVTSINDCSPSLTYKSFNVYDHICHHDSDHSTNWGYCPGINWDSDGSVGGIFCVESLGALYYYQTGSPTN